MKFLMIDYELLCGAKMQIFCMRGRVSGVVVGDCGRLYHQVAKVIYASASKRRRKATKFFLQYRICYDTGLQGEKSVAEFTPVILYGSDAPLNQWRTKKKIYTKVVGWHIALTFYSQSAASPPFLPGPAAPPPTPTDHRNGTAGTARRTHCGTPSQ